MAELGKIPVEENKYKLMEDLDNWSEKTKGLYRYVVAANVCYEIHIIKWVHNTDILKASAYLYLAGDWHSATGVATDYFEREPLLAAPESTVKDCIKAAIQDRKENMSD